MRFRSLRPLTAALALLTAAGAGAQEVSDPKTNSPFSRFGLGDLARPGYATQSAMGGVGIAYANPHIANPTNPASLGALRFATYQVGVDVSRDRLSGGGAENEGLNGNLGYLSLAFTTRNTLNDLLDARRRKTRYATLLSVTPYATQGYNVELTSQQAEVGTVVNTFLGTGGFYRLRSAHALEIGERLRLGVSASYLFGRTNIQNRVGTTDLATSSVITDTEAFRVRGVELAAGVQRDLVLARVDERATRLLSLGATFRYTGDLTGSGTRTITRTNAFSARDTLNPDATALEQRYTMPMAYGFGVVYKHINKLQLGADFEVTNWDRFRNNLRPDERLTSGYRIAVGGEWVPDIQAYNKYHRQVRYRFGAYLQQDPREAVTADRGLSLGVGLPVVRPREELSYVNLSINAGNLVTPGDIDQRYLRLTAGFTLTDNSWFYKRRFK